IITIFTVISLSSCQKNDDIINDIIKEETKLVNLSGTFKSDIKNTEYSSNTSISFYSSGSYSYSQTIIINNETVSVNTSGNWKYIDDKHSEIILTVSDNSDSIDMFGTIEYADKNIISIIINNSKFIKQ
ncbi:MAG: hypothetical protein K2K88_09165, partial [Muribaculaceae bacterium]|nr:hypothetical protein [Muribaculaceae bacterium]